MIVKIATTAALSFSILAGTPVLAQTAPAPVQAAPTTAADWRTVAPENLLIIETAKGRILVELDPRVAPLSVERIRTLADRGFYDGLKFHRVVEGFMAQGGDPLGTGRGGSDLPDVPGEFHFRRGRDMGFALVDQAEAGLWGVIGSMAVITQPDAQMMVTADFKTDGQALFCPGVAGMARNNEPNSANSQFFLMMEANGSLNGMYTPFGRVIDGMTVVRSLNAGTEAQNGAVENPDVMTRVRTASALPEGQRPTARVISTTSPAFAAFVQQTKAARGAQFNVCDAQPPVQITGG